AWINWIDAGDAWLAIMANGQQDGPWENYGLFVNRGGGYLYFTLSLDGGHVTQSAPASVVAPGEWLHASATWDGSAARIYVNGEMVLEQAQTGTLVPPGLPLRIGHRNGSSHYFNGSIDEVRVYNHALTDVEIQAAMEDALPYPYALGPSPEDGALHEDTWVNLGWSPGDSAVSHDVYLGENFDDVNDAAVDSPVFRGNQASTSYIAGFIGYAYPEGLVPGTTYYWRIDEVNEADPNSPWKGNVWSFWIPPRTAYEPAPADGINFVLQDATLGWTAGFGASLHQVYFGENADEVANAAGGALQQETTFSPSALESGKTYYWRVDEFDGLATHKGDVWSFQTVPELEITDPTLVGWWTFDEGRGLTAVDWSGHGNHGSVETAGDPLWVDGYHGGAMDMAGVTSVHIPAESWSTIENQATLAMWTFGDPAGVPNTFNFGAFAGGSRVFSVHVPWGGNVYFDSGQTPGDDYDRIYTAAKPSQYRGNWRHWTFVKNAETGVKEIYLDGELWYSQGGMTRAMTGVTEFALGSHPNGANPYRGIMDDVRLYNTALTAEQIAELMLGNTKLAGSPVPERLALVDIRDIDSLSWSAGDSAVSHDVYLGTDRDAVAGADNSAPEFQGNQTGTSLSLASLVEFGGGDYYWRVDEIEADGTVHTGTLWKFTVPDYLIVDNFESYDDIDPAPGEPGLNRIFDKWIDGYGTLTNGAIVGNDMPPYAEQNIVYGGSQSLVYRYDNAGKTSEATLTLAKSDWTVEGVTKLSLWLRGDSANAADRIYIAVNGTAVIYHDDASATQLSGWNEWVINLSDFGVDLTNVNTITIGVGTRNVPAPGGGQGTLYFDDIRLYR
ncbi:MAG: LamG domain-containing protein, partial [Phycisphaerales bacterium]